MKSSFFLTFFSLIALALATLDVPEFSEAADFGLIERKAKKPKCVKGIHIIAIRGNGAMGGPFGIAKPLVQALLKAVPNSDAVPVPYPKNESIREANAPAVATMTKEIETYVAMCPTSKIVLAGYSEGAGITMNVICGTDGFLFTSTPTLPKKYTKNIIASIVYSDGSRVKGQSYDLGSCQNSGLFPRDNPQACKPYAPVIQSYCNSNDGFCCQGGSNHSTHFTYFKMFDAKVEKFVVSQFKKFSKG